MAFDAKRDYVITDRLTIPAHEVWFEYSHASGPGGQNVNKVETVASLCFSPSASGALSDAEKARVARRLGNGISKEGILRITSAVARSQAVNRELAAERFRAMLAEALKPVKKRVPTRPTRASRERRLADKRHNSLRKRQRGDDDDTAHS